MRLLLDTQLLIWIGQNSPRLSRRALTIVNDAEKLLFSTVSIAEVAIKRALNRPDFAVDAHDFRSELLANDYEELPLSGEHACQLVALPPVHKDPFDRMLVAQAASEGLVFVTADVLLGRYGKWVAVV